MLRFVPSQFSTRTGNVSGLNIDTERNVWYVSSNIWCDAYTTWWVNNVTKPRYLQQGIFA